MVNNIWLINVALFWFRLRESAGLANKTNSTAVYSTCRCDLLVPLGIKLYCTVASQSCLMTSY